MQSVVRSSLAVGFVLTSVHGAAGQQPAGAVVQAPATAQAAAPVAATELPPGYVIGVQDVLSIVFWRDKDMSADVTVRPDGKISLPLLNEVQAAGQTPE